MTIPDLPSGFSRLRRNWRAATAIVVAATLAAVLIWWVQSITAPDDTRKPLAADSARGDGAQAAVTLARNAGTTVTSYGSWDAAMDDAQTTVVVANWAHMSYKDAKTLANSAANLVLVNPRSGDLSAFDLPLTVTQPGLRLPTHETAECNVAASSNVTTALGYWNGLSLDDDAADSASYQPCFALAEATADQPAQYGLYTTTRDGRTITVIGTSLPFENRALARADNAALALNTLTATDTVAWWLPEYVPGAAGDDDADHIQMTPPYLGHVFVVLLLTFLAVWLWQGRRFGPIVREKMPVHVKSVEAMHGLATLYRRSGEAGHAARLIRSGAKHRLSSAVGCGPHTADDVLFRFVADRIDGDADQIADVFTRAVHSTDQLHQLLTDLNRLHAATEQPPAQPASPAASTAVHSAAGQPATTTPNDEPGPSADQKVMT